MRKIGMMWAIVVMGCVGGSEPAPDAALRTVHDQAFFTPCDPAWTVNGVGPASCASACLVKPVEFPCGGKSPCNDHGACVGATSNGQPVDCTTTFVATDYLGDHVGCCQIWHTSARPEVPIPMFYECPAK